MLSEDMCSDFVENSKPQQISMKEFYHFGKILGRKNKFEHFSFGEEQILLDFEGFYLQWLRRPSDPLINLHRYEFILNSNQCELQPPFIIVVIHSVADAFKRRRLIRSTYGSVKQYGKVKLDFVFVLGETLDAKVNKKILAEQKEYNDLIQGNYLDKYENLLYKHLFAYVWVQKFCWKAKFVMKIDDDVILSTRLVVDFLMHRNNSVAELYLCRYLFSLIHSSPKREPRGHKWALPLEVYPFSSFPPYCIGHAYLFSMNFLDTILEYSKFVPFLRLDDVYMGFVKWIGGIKMFEIENFIWYLENPGDVNDVPCSMFYSIQNGVLKDQNSVHKLWNSIWQGIKNNYFCSLFGKSWETYVRNIDIV